MLFTKPKSLISEAASADMLNPEVSEEVKDVIEDLEDTLTNNVEEVKDSDKTTNGGIPVVAESVAIMESANTYGDAKYLIKLEDVMAVMESEGEEAAAEAMEEPGEAPSAEDVAAAEPEPEDVIEDIANKNGVDPEQVAVVITSESVKFFAETALMESKCGKEGKACKKLKKIKDITNKLRGKVKMVKA